MMYAEQLQHEAANITTDYYGIWTVAARITSVGPNTDRYQLLLYTAFGLKYDINGDTADQVLNGLRDRMDADFAHARKVTELPF